jgi:predicted flap endonuclease-1-like 5' DNA nuclease
MTVKVDFYLKASRVQNAKGGLLIGDFNQWDVNKGIALNLNEDGSLSGTLNLTLGKKYEYRYLLSDGRWENDDNPKVLKNAYGQIVENCIINTKEISKNKSNSELKSGKTMTSKPDDLTKILGVTPKIQTLLKSESITTYVELGRCTIKKLLLILDIVNNKKKINYYTTWAKQAKLAAAGKWDELTELQKKIELEA